MKKFALSAFFLLATFVLCSQSSVAQSGKKVKGTKVEMTTSYGKIVVLLYDDTPLHKANFLKLVKDGSYEGTLFHRVISRFMIQAGDPESKTAKPGQMLGAGTLGYTVPAEINPKYFHKRGALCAARLGDHENPKRESSSCQFYIVQGQVWTEADLNAFEQRGRINYSPEQRKAYTTVGGSPHLDGDYTVFGEVLEGMDVVDKIAAAPRGTYDRPLQDIRIEKMKVIK